MKLELDKETIAKLALLGRQVSPEGASEEQRACNAVRHLIQSAMDGMRRPGAWERHWLAQAFFEDWIEHMEQCPETPYSQLRLRRGRE